MISLVSINSGYTVDDLVNITGRAKSTVRQKRGLSNFLLGEAPNPSGRGANIKIFKKDAIHLWLPRQQNETIMQSNTKPNRKNRSDRGSGRKLEIETEVKIITSTFGKYMSQAQSKNIRESCLNATLEYAEINGEIPNFPNPYVLAEYLYQKRIMRKDKYFVGFAHKGNWKLRHKKRWQKKSFNNLMPYNRWDYIALFTDAGLLGKGYGAAKLWVIDGTQFDAWVKVKVDGEDESQLISYLQIMDGLTGYPLLVQPIKSESIEAVAKAIAKCYEIYGVPEYGIVLDNSKTFRSAHIKSFIHNFFTDSAIAEFNKKGSWFRKIFPGQEAPTIFNLPNIPRFPLKSCVERSFKQHKDKHVATAHAQSYQGADRTEAVRLSLNNTAVLSQKFSANFGDAWDNFIYWLYNEYVNRIQTHSLTTFKKISGELPTIANAFKFYGAGTNKLAFPEENKSQLYYYLSPKEFRHTIKAKLGFVTVTHKRDLYNYHCIELDHEYYNRKVCAIPDWREADTAYIYLVHDKQYQDDRTPEPGSVFFIGMAHNALIDSLKKTEYIYARKTNQKIQEKAFGDEEPKFQNWESKNTELSDNNEKLLFKNRIKHLSKAKNKQKTENEIEQGISPRHDPIPEPENEPEPKNENIYDLEVDDLLSKPLF